MLLCACQLFMLSWNIIGGGLLSAVGLLQTISCNSNWPKRFHLTLSEELVYAIRNFWYGFGGRRTWAKPFGVTAPPFGTQAISFGVDEAGYTESSARQWRRTHRPVQLCEVCHRQKTKASQSSPGASIRLADDCAQKWISGDYLGTYFIFFVAGAEDTSLWVCDISSRRNRKKPHVELCELCELWLGATLHWTRIRRRGAR